MLGAREAPGGILGSLGSPRGYASAHHVFAKFGCGYFLLPPLSSAELGAFALAPPLPRIRQ